MYLITAVGVTVGFHRLLTHRAFQTYPWLERVFAVMGSLSVQGSVMDWVADHRKHHAHADKEGDPHSPHVGHGSGLAGLWHAHTGWLLETQGQADWKRYAAELYEDPRMRRIGKRFPWLVLRLTADSDGCGLRPAAASPGRARCAATSGAASCGSSSCTTSPGRSTRSATSSAAAASTSRTSRRTWPGCAAVARRVLAPQPPRVPALGAFHGLQLVGDRPVGPADRRPGARRPGLERRADHARAPAREGRRPRPGSIDSPG